MDEASMTFADTKPLIERPLPRATRKSKRPFDSESPREPSRSYQRCSSWSCHNLGENQYLIDFIRDPIPSLTSLPGVRVIAVAV